MQGTVATKEAERPHTSCSVDMLRCRLQSGGSAAGPGDACLVNASPEGAHADGGGLDVDGGDSGGGDVNGDIYITMKCLFVSVGRLSPSGGAGNGGDVGDVMNMPRT